MNGQIVICPGWNDGDQLRRTLRDLYEAENTARSEEVTPMEEWASAAQFQDADPTDNTETEDE